MAKFVYKKRIGRRSKKELNSLKTIGTPKKPIYSSIFQNEFNGSFFELTDVEILKFKRGKEILTFFETYSDKNKYDLIEFGLPYSVSNSIGVIIQKIKRRCEKMGTCLLGYFWVYDVGEENFGEHFHLIIAIPKLLHYKYPEELKIDFKKQKIHGDVVRKQSGFKNYLKNKQLFDRGHRKRLFGKSRTYNK